VKINTILGAPSKNVRPLLVSSSSAHFPSNHRGFGVYLSIRERRYIIETLQPPEPTLSVTENFVDAAAAAQFLRIGRKTMLRMARSGALPAYPIGNGKRKRWRFRLGELERFITKTVVDSH
jgi:excisionase family DNA binding protein